MNAELIRLLDKAIGECSGRDIVPAVEIVDVLLDMRLILMASEVPEQLEGAGQ